MEVVTTDGLAMGIILQTAVDESEGNIYCQVPFLVDLAEHGAEFTNKISR